MITGLNRPSGPVWKRLQFKVDECNHSLAPHSLDLTAILKLCTSKIKQSLPEENGSTSLTPVKNKINVMLRMMVALIAAGSLTSDARTSPLQDNKSELSLASDCGCTSYSTWERALQPPAPAVEPIPAHDPTIARDGKSYYLYTTGEGVPFSSSTDLIHWKPMGAVFQRPPAWAGDLIPGFKSTEWAPHIVKYHDRWLLFYAVSTFGANRSAIGLATNVTLDPTSNRYAWKDEGLVVETHKGDRWNAIDPNFSLDRNGSPWLAFGSFWSGLKLIPLDRETCKPLQASTFQTVIPIAERAHTPDVRGAIEAPFIFMHKEYYYLFASFDLCCKGVDSTYNVRVGRAKEITGPYLDKEGRSMLDGGGTQVLFPDRRWKGPGHNAVIHAGGIDRIVYHAYDADDSGRPKLQIRDLKWSRDGWPSVMNEASAPE